MRNLVVSPQTAKAMLAIASELQSNPEYRDRWLEEITIVRENTRTHEAATSEFLEKIILQSADINTDPYGSAIDPPKEFEAIKVESFGMKSVDIRSSRRLHAGSIYKNRRTGDSFTVVFGSVNTSYYSIKVISNVTEDERPVLYKHVVSGDIFELQESK